MSKAYKCDLCENFYDNETNSRTFAIDKLHSTGWKHLDICPTCYNRIIETMDKCKNFSDKEGIGDKK